MAGISPFEKRHEPRSSYDERGLFRPEEGDESTLLRLRDVATTGAGAFSQVVLNKGTRGVLSVKLPGDDISKSYQSEVIWCLPCGDAANPIYHYRVGLALVSPDGDSKKAGTKASPVSRADASHRVKGSLIIDLAKAIREHHDKPWQNYLQMEDMRIIADMIIPAAWYPLATYRRAGMAVFEVLAGGDPDKARQWGRDAAERIPEDLFKNFFDKKDPKAAAKNYVSVNMRGFDFMRFRFRDAGEKKIEVAAAGKDDLVKVFPEIRFLGLIMAGTLEKLLEMNGASGVSSTVREQDQPEEPVVIELEWN